MAVVECVSRISGVSVVWFESKVFVSREHCCPFVVDVLVFDDGLFDLRVVTGLFMLLGIW